MTGSWLIVKWVGIAILAFYLVLILVAIWRFRARSSRLGSELYLPMILGNFVSLSVPSIFENVAVARVCFIVAHAIYMGGILILVRGLAQKGKVLLKTEG
jgi:hypothetical protein